MANCPVAFALTPALANREVLDFNDPADTKLFKAAAEKLPIKFDCNAENLPLFLAQLQDRAAVYDWLALLLIPKDGNEKMTRNWNARELTSSQATIVSRKSQSQRI
jgi:hypothetical protein